MEPEAYGRLPQVLWVALTFAAGNLLCYALEIPSRGGRKLVKGGRYDSHHGRSRSVAVPVVGRGARGWAPPEQAYRKWLLHAAFDAFFLWGATLFYLAVRGLQLELPGVGYEYIAALAMGGWFILTQAAAFAVWHRKTNFVPSMGIINVVWTVLCGAALTLVYAMGYLVESTSAASPLGQQLLLAMMTKIIDGTLTLGGVLATAMSILWAGQVWRNAHTPEGLREYKITAVSASKMVVAYFAIIAAFGLWVGVPLVTKLSAASAWPKLP